MSLNSKVKNGQTFKVRWGIDAIIEEVENSKHHTDEDQEDSYEDQDDVIFYKWDFKRLDNLFDEPNHGRAFKNAIFSLWLKGVTEYIVNMDH